MDKYEALFFFIYSLSIVLLSMMLASIWEVDGLLSPEGFIIVLISFVAGIFISLFFFAALVGGYFYFANKG